MSIWKTRMFVLLIIVLVFGVGYSYIVTEETNLQDQALHHEMISVDTSLGELQFQIEDTIAQALGASTFSLQLIPVVDSDTNEQDRLADDQSLPAQTNVSVALNMLSMDCGTVHFTMRSNELGIYYGEGIPVMPGIWVATATVTYADQPQDERIQLSFSFVVE